MLTRSLFVRLEAKPGKEREVAALLIQGLELANREEIAMALMEQAPSLLAAPLAIEPMDVLGSKLPR